jgi:cytochrome b561
MLKNTLNSYGTVTQTFHWAIAVAIVGMLTVGFIMAALEPSPTKWMLFDFHKATGFCILILVLSRLTWRWVNPVPLLPSTLTPWHRRIAQLSPFALYSILILMPLSGYVLSNTSGHPINVYDLFTVPNLLANRPEVSKMALMIHQYVAFVFIGILTLHVGAAFYHHFVLKSNVLRRMLPSWIFKA